jgi:sugar lactone lactonase YvrE
MFGPDGKLYSCETGKKRIVAYDPAGKEETVADGLDSNDLAVAHNGNIYISDPGTRSVWLVDAARKRRAVDVGISRPNGLRLSPDQSLLYVDDTGGQFVYSFHIEPDGSLTNKQKFFYLHFANDSVDSQADGMTVDKRGWLYVTSELGLQICDPAGRVEGIIPKPQNRWLSNVVFGGANFDTLYVTCGDKVFKRKTKVTGVRSADAPIKPPAPRL